MRRSWTADTEFTAEQRWPTVQEKNLDPISIRHLRGSKHSGPAWFVGITLYGPAIMGSVCSEGQPVEEAEPQVHREKTTCFCHSGDGLGKSERK